MHIHQQKTNCPLNQRKSKFVLTFEKKISSKMILSWPWPFCVKFLKDNTGLIQKVRPFVIASFFNPSIPTRQPNRLGEVFYFPTGVLVL